MKTNFFGFFIFMVIAGTAVAPGSAWAATIEVKFENLKTLVEERNAKVESARLEKRAAEERSGGLARSFLPKLEISGAYETFKTGGHPILNQPALGAEMSVNLYNGGRDSIESDVNSVAVQRKGIQLQQTVADELQEIRKIFWEIIFTQEWQALIDSGIKMNGQNLAAAERRIRSGVATESDRVEFEMKAVALKQEYAKAKLNLDRLTRDFYVLLGFDKTDQIIFPKELDHQHEFESLLKHTDQDHDFLFKDDELLSEQQSLNAKYQRRSWLPEVDAFVAYRQYNQSLESAGPDAPGDLRQENMMGVRVRMGFGKWWGASRESSALSAEVLASQKRASQKRKQVDVHIENELAELRLLHDLVHDADVNIERAEKYYKLTQSEYARGVKNSPDVLGASEKLLESKLKRLEITRDFQVSKSHVLAKIGR